MSYKLTDEQICIVNEEIEPPHVMQIRAFAGTGKTFILERYTEKRPNKKFLYLAFNASVRKEAQRKFPKNVTCHTTHSLAWQYYGQNYRHKLKPFMHHSVVSDELRLENFYTAKVIQECLKNFLISSDREITTSHFNINAKKICWDHSQDHGLRIPLTMSHGTKEQTNKISKAKREALLSKINLLWERMIDPQDVHIPMLHDGYLKLFHLSKPILRYDYILLDEAQDTNPVTADIILSQKCAKILVGDPHQQIYSFRGAKNYMQQVDSKKTLYLTKSFRFGSNVSELATLILQNFKYETNVVKGVSNGDRIGSVEYPYTLISRSNAGVFQAAIQAINKDKKIGFVGGLKGYNLDEIEEIYYLYTGDTHKIRHNKYLKKYSSFYHLAEEAEEHEDFTTTARCKIVQAYNRKIPEFIETIKRVAVPPKRANILLTTAHKVKGLEFDSVRINNDFPPLMQDTLPVSPKTYDADEFNLYYVSITRAKKNLEISETLEGFVKFLETNNSRNFLNDETTSEV